MILKDFAISLHKKPMSCVFTNSVNFRVYHIPTVTIEAGWNERRFHFIENAVLTFFQD